MKFLKKKKAATLTGYGLLVGLIAVTGIAAITNMGEQVTTLFSSVGNKLENVETSGVSGSGGSGSGGGGPTCSASPETFPHNSGEVGATTSFVIPAGCNTVTISVKGAGGGGLSGGAANGGDGGNGEVVLTFSD